MSIKKEYSKSHNFADFSKRYVEYLNNTLKSLNFNKLEKISKEFELVKRKNKTIYVFGNGGAASTAITMSNDLGFDVMNQKGSSVKSVLLSSKYSKMGVLNVRFVFSSQSLHVDLTLFLLIDA